MERAVRIRLENKASASILRLVSPIGDWFGTYFCTGLSDTRLPLHKASMGTFDPFIFHWNNMHTAHPIFFLDRLRQTGVNLVKLVQV